MKSVTVQKRQQIWCFHLFQTSYFKDYTLFICTEGKFYPMMYWRNRKKVHIQNSILIVSEMKTPDGKDLRYQFYNYWFILCVIMIWIPTILMIFAYNMISFKLRLSLKAFPYLSQQSRIARSRQKVIQMLFVLIIIELICWGPWQFYVLCEFIFHHIYDVENGEVFPDVRSSTYLN